MSQPRATFRGLLAGEVIKLLGRPWLLWAALAPAVAVALKLFSLRVVVVQQALAGGSGSLEGPLVDTAFRPATQALGTGAQVASVIVAVVAALSLAEERRLGTLRTLLAGPIRRWRFFAAKLFGILFLSVLLVASATGVAVLAGAMLGDYVAGPEWEYSDLTVDGMWRILALAAALSCAGVFAAGCLGLLASAITSSGVAALITLVILVTLLQSAAAPFSASTREIWQALMPLTYVTHPAEFAAQQVSGITSSSWCVLPLRGREPFEPWLPWIVCALGASLFAGLGLAIFSRRQVL